MRLSLLSCIRLCNLRTTLFTSCLLFLVLTTGAAIAALSAPNPGAILAPGHIGGEEGPGLNAVDIYPALAYDTLTGRYLAIWMSLRNTQALTDGFDVYGVFLDSTGQPAGAEFRISDSNTAALNGPPAVAAGRGEFAVVWTERGPPCRIYGQRVTDTSARPDHLLASGSTHHHRPTLVYNKTNQQYGLAYVAGDDYLPPALPGFETADCGNNQASASHIKARLFSFKDDTPRSSPPGAVSGQNSGAFRPRLAYSAGLDQYLVVWEDRRQAGDRLYRFDVYARRLDKAMTPIGAELPLAAGGEYPNDDRFTPWTPRPAIAAGDDQFLAAWFTRRITPNDAVIWAVEGRLTPGAAAPAPPVTIAEATFEQAHIGQSPTGFLAAVYLKPVREYLVGMTNHLELEQGYLSLAHIQRLDQTGELLGLDGSSQNQPGGRLVVDPTGRNQITIAIAMNPESGPEKVTGLIVYGNHSENQPVQNFDIWGAPVQILPAPVEAAKSVDKRRAAPGDLLTYTIVVAATTGRELAAASVSDALPRHTTYLDGSAHIAPPGAGLLTATEKGIKWTGPIPAGSAITLTFKVTVDPALSETRAITNVVALEGDIEPGFTSEATTLVEVRPAKGVNIRLPVILK